MDREAAGWLHPESHHPWLSVTVETKDERCPLGVLGLVLFVISINSVGSGTEHTFCKQAGNAKLSRQRDRDSPVKPTGTKPTGRSSLRGPAPRGAAITRPQPRAPARGGAPRPPSSLLPHGAPVPGGTGGDRGMEPGPWRLCGAGGHWVGWAVRYWCGVWVTAAGGSRELQAEGAGDARG